MISTVSQHTAYFIKLTIRPGIEEESYLQKVTIYNLPSFLFNLQFMATLCCEMKDFKDVHVSESTSCSLILKIIWQHLLV